MQKRLPALLLFALLFSGCSQSSSSTGGAETELSTVESESVLAYGLADGTPLTANADEVQVEYGRLRAEAVDILSSDQPLAVRDRQLRTFLSEHEDFILHPYLAQLVSVRLVREALDVPDESALEYVERYAGLLVESGSPEAALIARSLVRLRGHWSDERIGRAARLTIDRAVSWAEKVCTTCGSAGKQPSTPGRPDLAELEAKRHLVLNAVDDLRKMAGP